MLLKFISSSVILILLSVLSYCYHIINLQYVPEIKNDFWWGINGKEEIEDKRIHMFNISVSKREIDDLQLRFNISRGFTPSLETTQHQYGLNSIVLQKYIEKLKQNEYNFIERQNFLNSHPQFTTKIQGLTFHFLHVKPENNRKLPVLPLLLLHGWPSSVREFYQAIPLLTSSKHGQKFVLELVIPSLPGFGYSETPAKPNCHSPHVANMMRILMKRLGHENFFVHGSDWGAIVATSLATLYPENILGFHSNFCLSLRLISLAKMFLGALYPRLVVSKEHEKKMYPLFGGLLKFYLAESGYLHIFGSKPDTIGHALDTSPEGLISQIFEKLSVGMNRNNIHLLSAGLDKLDFNTLMDITLFYYWFPKAATTAARFYAENLSINGMINALHNTPISEKVPCGCAFFEHEFIYQPESILRDKFTNLVHYTTYQSIGHFAAIEANEVLAKDIISFVTKTGYY